MGRTTAFSSSAASEDPILQRYEEQFRALRAELADLGFFCKGTLLARRVVCGKVSCCGCAKEPARRHGPYFEWTYKVAGKTVNVRLSPDAAPLYREGTAEWRRLRALLRRWEALSRRPLGPEGPIMKRAACLPPPARGPPEGPARGGHRQSAPRRRGQPDGANPVSDGAEQAEAASGNGQARAGAGAEISRLTCGKWGPTVATSSKAGTSMEIIREQK